MIKKLLTLMLFLIAVPCFALNQGDCGKGLLVEQYLKIQTDVPFYPADIPVSKMRCWWGTEGSDQMVVSGTKIVINQKIVGNYDPTLYNLFFGKNGNDVILTGDGPDVLVGGFGSDILYGRKGQDILDGQDYVQGYFYMMLIFERTTPIIGRAKYRIQANLSPDDLPLEGKLWYEFLTSTDYKEIESFANFRNLAGKDSLNGQEGVDELIGQFNSNLIIGGNDCDRLIGTFDPDLFSDPEDINHYMDQEDCESVYY